MSRFKTANKLFLFFLLNSISTCLNGKNLIHAGLLSFFIQNNIMQ